MKCLIDFSQSVQRYIEANDLARPDHKIIVGFSGGPDSIALLRCLHELNYSCIAAHCNFHLRDEESIRDEEFVKKVCHELDIPFEVAHFDTRQEALTHGESIEMAARRLRYDWFEALRLQYHADSIAVGHHKNDSVETLLLNLIRGTGVKGLCGIQAKQGMIIRPLLGMSREEIDSYLDACNFDSVLDSSNLSHDYLRNRIRHEVLPLLAEMNPSIVETLANTTLYMQEVASMMQASTHNYHIWVEQGVIPIDALLAQTSPELILHELIAPLGFNSSQQSSILECARTGQCGRQFESKTGWSILRDRDGLLIRPSKHEAETVPDFSIEFTQYKVGDALPSFSKKTALIDADAVHLPLHLRRWKKGDRFSPYGMEKGSKLVSDFLTDKKVSMVKRENTWVLCDDEDKIVWLVGHEIAHPYRLRKESTTVLCMQCVPVLEDQKENPSVHEGTDVKYL